jgi:hypothetical protein
MSEKAKGNSGRKQQVTYGKKIKTTKKNQLFLILIRLVVRFYLNSAMRDIELLV